MEELKKSDYFRLLKDAGVTFSKHYRDYTKDELRNEVVSLGIPVTSPQPEQEPRSREESMAAHPSAVSRHIIHSDDPLDAFAGMRQNEEFEGPIRIDSAGREWMQEEIRKPSFPKPRARRKLQYIDSGVTEHRVRAGEYTETFEVAGNESRASEVKITLPSYQVGIYRDPRFPFLVHVYNEQIGFDLFEVQDFYGGPERVPEEIKKIYIENVLCFDVRTTIRAIEAEAREKKLHLVEGVL